MSANRPLTSDDVKVCNTYELFLGVAKIGRNRDGLLIQVQFLNTPANHNHQHTHAINSMTYQDQDVQLVLKLSDVEYLLETLEEEIELLGKDRAQGSREKRLCDEILLQTYDLVV